MGGGGGVKAQPKLASFRLGRRVYAYRSIDLAFAARDREGRLFAPVVRDADRLSPEQLVDECARLTMGLFRGQLRAEEVAGGCMTVSILDQQPVLWHVGLQNAYQSAILTMGAIREQVVWSDGRAVGQSMAALVLSYDHGLLDGWEAAGFVDHVAGRSRGWGRWGRVVESPLKRWARLTPLSAHRLLGRDKGTGRAASRRILRPAGADSRRVISLHGLRSSATRACSTRG